MAATVKILDLYAVDVELPSLLRELEVHMFECTLKTIGTSFFNNLDFI